MNVESMEVGCVEKCSLTSIWEFLQSLKSLVEKDAKRSHLKLSPELGRFGRLIVVGRWRRVHRKKVDMRSMYPNMNYVSEELFFFEIQDFL